MFDYTKFEALCTLNNTTPFRVYKSLGFPQSGLSAWKSGAYKPKADKVKAIADMFNVSIETLMK